jgi:hypothetical protein
MAGVQISILMPGRGAFTAVNTSSGNFCLNQDVQRPEREASSSLPPYVDIQKQKTKQRSKIVEKKNPW